MGIRAFITNLTEGAQIDAPISVRVKVILVNIDLTSLRISVPEDKEDLDTTSLGTPPPDHAANTYSRIITLTESAVVPCKQSRP